jgi:two-component system chemotaxis response regulator CheY
MPQWRHTLSSVTVTGPVLTWRRADRCRRVATKTLLIVDDSPTIRRMVRAALQPVSDLIAEASSGLHAIEQLTLAPVELMVLDLNMPDMHGLEVLKFVRQHPAYNALPVVVLTTRADDVSRDAALAAGATLYMTKPFTPQVLADNVRALLRSTRAREERHVDR